MVESGAALREQFAFNAGRLCLDFANTVRSRPSSDRLDLIGTYSDLLGWARQATILTPGRLCWPTRRARESARWPRHSPGPGRPVTPYTLSSRPSPPARPPPPPPL